MYDRLFLLWYNNTYLRFAQTMKDAWYVEMIVKQLQDDITYKEAQTQK